MISPYVDFSTSMFKRGYEAFWAVLLSYSSSNKNSSSRNHFKNRFVRKQHLPPLFVCPIFCSLHQCSLFFLCAFVRSGFFLATQPFNPLSCSLLLIVLKHTTVSVESANSALFIPLDVAFLLNGDRRFRRRFWHFDVTRGRPVLTLSFTVPVSPFFFSIS